MQEERTLRVIARLRGDYGSKFGVPRQSGLAPARARVVFEPAFRDANALKGIEGYSHLWLLWGFGELPERQGFSPMVKPPRLGGNTRMGVFATRSPNRPNPIGLSCVALIGVEKRPGEGCVLLIEGADMVDGTPIYDIKPYLPFTDAHPQARGGFAQEAGETRLAVVFPPALLAQIPAEKQAALLQALALDPRPAYQDDPALPYGMRYAGRDVRFTVSGGTLTVFAVEDEASRPVK